MLGISFLYAEVYGNYKVTLSWHYGENTIAVNIHARQRRKNQSLESGHRGIAVDVSVKSKNISTIDNNWEARSNIRQPPAASTCR